MKPTTTMTATHRIAQVVTLVGIFLPRRAEPSRFGSHLSASFVALAPAVINKQHHVIRHSVRPFGTSATVSERLPISAGTISSKEHSLEDYKSSWDGSAEKMIKLRILSHRLSDVDDPKNNPLELMRFLDEFDNDETIAENKFRAMIQWRQEENIDNLLQAYHPPSLYRYFPAGVLKGADRDGDPIHVERTGVADTSGLLSRYGRDEMVKQAVWLREVQSRGRWIEDYEQEQGHPVKQFTVILDMEGLSPKNIAPSILSVGQEVSQIVQDYYPGFAKRVIIIRASVIFQLAYNAMKPFLDTKIKEKIVVVNGNTYAKVLDEYMDLNLLPHEIYTTASGQAVDDFDTVWKGGKIPEHEEAARVHLPAESSRPSTTTENPAGTNPIARRAQVAAKMSSSNRFDKVKHWLNFDSLDGGYFGHPI